MTGFVAKHCAQLGFGVEITNYPARDVNIPAGQGEGVDFGGIKNGIVVAKIGSVAVAREFLAYLVDVFLQLWRVINVVLLPDFSVGAAAHADFLRLAYDHEIRVSGDRIGCAGSKPKRKPDDAGPQVKRRLHLVILACARGGIKGLLQLTVEK